MMVLPRETLFASPQAVIINEKNLNTGIVKKEQSTINSNFYWHKIFVRNATNFTRDFVLRTIMKALYPLDFIPVCYDIEDEYATFLLKNCGAAISEMCRLSLIIPHADMVKNLPPFKLSIGLKHSAASDLKIEIQENIQAILRRRFNALTRTLDLQAFIKDPALVEFCSLSQPKLMYFVLHLSRDFSFEHLKLGMNEIEIMKPIEALQNKSIKTIDLRNNNISNADKLDVLKSFPITEIYLEGNPIASQLCNEGYVKIVRDACPRIQKIDGCKLPSVGALPFQRNYVCSPTATTFADQFVEHFFTLYDSPHRHLLMQMYHRGAIMTITSQYIGELSGLSSNIKLYEYKKYSRNLSTLSDMSKAMDCVYLGPTNIGNMLKVLPTSEHDPYSFTVDVVYYTNKTIVLSVSGVFKQPGESLLVNDYFFAFTRTFVLTAVGNMEYNIANEMVHLTNAPAVLQNIAFKVVKVPRTTVIKVVDAKSYADKEDMINAFMAITQMRGEWAIKCLRECDFNLERALVLFMDLFKADKISATAFEFETNGSKPKPVPVVAASNMRPLLANPERLPMIPAQPALLPNPPLPPVELRPPPPPPQPVPRPMHPKSQPLAKLQTRLPAPPPPPQTSPNKKRTRRGRDRPQKLNNVDVTKALQPRQTDDKRVRELQNQVKILQDQAKQEATSRSTAQKDAEEKKKQSLAPVPPVPAVPAVDPQNPNVCEIGDLQEKHVSDPIIKKVLNMSPDTAIESVKENLAAACKQVLANYTCALKYYKALGREFYRFQLYSDARSFLADAMATIPKKMGEQLYFIFILFEIQYGDMNVAENMVLITADSVDIQHTGEFIADEVAKVNVQFARKLFGAIAVSNLAPVKKDVLMKAYVQFERTHGNIETLKYANKVYEGSCAKAQQLATPSNPVVHQPAKLDVEEKRLPVAVPQQEKQVENKQVPEKPKENVNPTVVAPVQNPRDPKEDFEEFRAHLLRNAKLMPRKVEGPLIDGLLACNDRETIEKLGEKLISAYFDEFYVIRLVCKAWQRHNLTGKVAKSLGDIKKNFTDAKLFNPLILYMKIREDLDKNRLGDAKNKLFTHVKISTPPQIVQVIEDLLMDLKTNPSLHEFLDSTLRDAANNQHFPTNKQRLLMMLYLTFCKQMHSSSADETYKRGFQENKYFHPDDIVDIEKIRQLREAYEQSRNTSKFLSPSNFNEQIEEMRMYYFVGNAERARAIFNSFGSRTDANAVRAKLCGVYYEALFGKSATALQMLQATRFDSFNSKCVLLTCLRKNNSWKSIKHIIEKMYADIFTIANPYVQELLFKYHRQWLADGFNILDTEAIAKRARL